MNTTLRLVPLGGLGEIGMNCLVIETADDIVIVDCGVLFGDLSDFGVDFIVPNFSYLVERKHKVRAFLITHGHEDHIGALPYALRAGIRAPIFATPFTQAMIESRLQEQGLAQNADLNSYTQDKPLRLGSFAVRSIPVNHSIVEAVALDISTPRGRVVHTGDFKIDQSPFYGSPIDLGLFKSMGDQGVELLLSDSTNVESHDHSLGDIHVFEQLEKHIADSKGMTLVSMFASNVGRMGQIVELATQLGKKLAVTGRSMEQNLRIALSCGYLKGSEGLLVPLDQIQRMPRDKLIVLTTGSQGETRSALARISHGEHSMIKVGQRDRVILSSKFIPGNELAISKVINQLFRQGADVLYESMHSVHVSGHACRPELKAMLNAVKPRCFIPVHGEYRHLVHHAQLAVECGVAPENVLVASNGDVVELEDDDLSVVQKLEDKSILIESGNRRELPRDALRERRKIAEAGLAVIVASRRDGKGRLSDPRVALRGLGGGGEEGFLADEAQSIASDALKDYEQKFKRGQAPKESPEEWMRIAVRQFLMRNLKTKPYVLPIVSED